MTLKDWEGLSPNGRIKVVYRSILISCIEKRNRQKGTQYATALRNAGSDSDKEVVIEAAENFASQNLSNGNPILHLMNEEAKRIVAQAQDVSTVHSMVSAYAQTF